MVTLRQMIDVPDEIMGLQTAVGLTIHAGGPGSGRHPGIHNYLMKKGWSFKGDRQAGSTKASLGSYYTHPKLGNIVVNKAGNWSHEDKHGGVINSTGKASLKENLRT